MQALKVAVIGLGWWGRVLVEQIGHSSRLAVVHAVDVDPAAEAFARERGLRFSTRLDDALGDSEVEAVVLCTPHTQHADQVEAVAAAGRHVFCEKPLALTRADAQRALGAVERAGVTLAVGHEKRFEPPIVEVLRLLRAGELGTPLQVEANFSQDKFLALATDNWRLSGREAPAGPMTATGIHLLDLSVAVFGAAERVLASVRQLGSPLTNGDTLAVMASFRRGGHALISAMLATPFAGRFAVYGSEGWAEVRDKAHPESPEGWTLTVSRRGGGVQTTDYPPAPAALLNLEAFADAAQGVAPYAVPAEQMLANISALEAVFRSARDGDVALVED
ncbi:MAG: Gfo/Idh/MocA family protein [Pigmentiphaga sp.]